MQFKDTPISYGWVSIFIHWAGAIAITMLWLIGNSISSEEIGQPERMNLIHMHTSVAISVYFLLFFRITYRLFVGFPTLQTNMSKTKQIFTRSVQILLIISLTVMLISGPLIVWANGSAIGIFTWGNIPSPFKPSMVLHEFMLDLHRIARWFLLVSVLTHVFGVFLSGPQTLNRMLITPLSSKQPKAE
ncbi:MAG: hypothetical protein CMM56_02220 [Rhodospirillaceae bacterium]|mgnify:CR=1 FL=1|nr:hypothetical protein [Rhodospirillaceae bacterium]|tara:strand:- start:22352 stop:22915 length:564 start_codon:yes stop_codon:yes gene_type:complete